MQFRQQKKYNNLLLLGAARGYDKDVVALVELGADLGFKDKKGLTALHYAAGNGRLETVKFLWSRGAEVDAETPDGRTPLHLAAQRGHSEVVTFLLQKGAWIDAEDARDNTPLHLAASRGHVGAVETLLKHGAKTASRNKHRLSPLGAALTRGHAEAAQSLLGWGAEFGGDRPGGFSLLHVAAGRGAAAGVKWLLDHGADVNEQDNPEGSTPLHAAVLGGEAEAVNILLEAGADASIANAEGRIPLDLVPAGSESKQANRMRDLLAAASKKGGGRKAAAAKGSAAKPAASEAKSPHEAFQALSESERRAKVELWATLAPADLAAALKGYPADVASESEARLAALRTARAQSNIHKAMAAAHADEEFQADAAQPHVSAAIDKIRADPSKYDQYAGDPLVVAVLGKMRRLHAVCQSNGQRTVNLEDMLVKPGANYEEQDAERSAALAAEVDAQLAAAIAGAAAQEGRAPEAAAAAYAAAVAGARQRWQERRQLGPAQPEEQKRQQSRPPQAASASKEGPSLLQKHGVGAKGAKEAGQPPFSGSATGKEEGETAASAEAIREMESRGRRDGGRGEEEEDEEKLPEWLKGGFSWKKVWQEFWRQTKLSLLMLLTFMLLAWIVRGRPPWQGAPRTRGTADGGAGAGAGAGAGGIGGASDEGSWHAEL